MSVPALTAREITDFLEEIWPGVTGNVTVEDVTDRHARVRSIITPDRLRPGGIVGGPVLMALADMAVWVAVLSVVGRVAMTVTVDLTIHFLRPAPPVDVIAEARLLKIGRRLAVGDVLMYSGQDPDPVAQATVTYAIPPGTDVPGRHT
ncbi:MAG TPA: PaaI family thioesterase [Acidimicrobiia bacterium]|nr:PaaI family thioesterase [Acidimicrobiia bacterium]